MIASEENGAWKVSLNLKQTFNDSKAIGTSIDVVAEEDELIFGCRLNEVEQRVQGAEVTMEVSNSEQAMELA